MPLTLERKKELVSQLTEVANSAVSSVISDHNGLTSNQMTDLRQKARNANIFLKVVNNRLAKRSIENTDLECLTETLVGPALLAVSNDDPGAPARLLRDFMKDNKALEIKAMSVSGQLYAADQLKTISSLPTRDTALSILMNIMLAPATQLVRVLTAPTVKCVQTIAAVAQSKG